MHGAGKNTSRSCLPHRLSLTPELPQKSLLISERDLRLGTLGSIFVFFSLFNKASSGHLRQIHPKGRGSDSDRPCLFGGLYITAGQSASFSDASLSGCRDQHI